MKRLLSVLIWAGGLWAQYAPVPSTQYPALEAILNAKPAIRAGTGVPSANCTQTFDLYLNTTNGALYVCSATNTWLPVSGGGSVTINGQTCTLGSTCTVADSTKAPLTGGGTSGTWGISVSGNAATASALAATPTPCGAGNYATGILANGNSTGCTPAGSGGGTAPYHASIANSAGPITINHNLNTVDILVACYESDGTVLTSLGTATWIIYPLRITDANNVSVTFSGAEAGRYCVVNGGVGPAGATGATGATGSNGTNGTNGTNGAGYAATSTTSFSIASSGSKAFTTQTGLAYTTASRARAASRANNANYMEGVVSSYSGTTLTITVDTAGGSGGPFTDWDVSVAGNPGTGTGSVTSVATTGPITGGTFTTSGTIACPTCVTSASALTNGQLVAGAGSQASAVTNLTGDVTTSGGVATTIAANAVTSAKMAAVNTRRGCTIVIGADNGAALVTADIAPQGRQCFVPAAAHVVEITVAADAGTPAVVVAKNHAGTLTDLSASLATAASGGLACANAAGSGTGIDGTTTCAVQVTTTVLAAGDWIETHTSASASTAKRMSITVTWTVD